MTIGLLHLLSQALTGETGLSLAEAEEETDLFLKAVAKTLWVLLCVLDNVIINKFYIHKYWRELGSTL